MQFHTGPDWSGTRRQCICTYATAEAYPTFASESDTMLGSFKTYEGVTQNHDRKAHRYVLIAFDNVCDSKPVRAGMGIDVTVRAHMRQRRHTQNVLPTEKNIWEASNSTK